MADGISQFYEDASNRLIRVPDAAWIVLRRIAGHPQAELDAITEEIKNAI